MGFLADFCSLNRNFLLYEKLLPLERTKKSDLSFCISFVYS